MLRALTLTLAAGGLVAGANADPHDVYGTFLTEAGTSKVEITDCGDATPCGNVVWIDPAAMNPGDTPETAITKAGDKIIGLLMLQSFDRKSKDWRGGTIYDPENDKTYAARLKRLEDGTLQLKGCIGPICQKQIWTIAAPVAE